MFAVDGIDFNTLFGRSFFDEIAAGHKGLLVCKGDVGARLDGGEGRYKTRHTHNCVKHNVGRKRGNFLYARRARQNFNVGIRRFQRKLLCGGLVGHGGVFRLIFSYLLLGSCRVFSRGKGKHAVIETVDDLESLSSYGAGGAQNSYCFQNLYQPLVII